MTDPERLPNPVPVTVKNWPDPPAKAPHIKNTTLKTYIIDPAGASGNKYIQIGDFEPTRTRVAIIVADADVMLTTDVPTTYPDTSSTTTPGQGVVLPKNGGNGVYEFFGPDTLYLVSLATITRVGVIKEYC